MSVVLVTGATGFIGSHLVEALLAKYDEVRCLVRSTSNLQWLPQDKVKLVEADLESGVGLESALPGVEIVFHLAGNTKALTAKDYFRGNVETTRNLLLAITTFAPQLKKLVLLSSQAAAGPAAQEKIMDETMTPCPLTEYGKSKLAAEQLLVQYPNIPSVILRAVSVYGPRDRDFLALIKIFQKGLAPLIGPRNKSLTFVHVADVVRALLLIAQEKKAMGRLYFVTDGHIYTFQELKKTLEKIQARRTLNLHFPRMIFWMIAVLAEGWSWITGNPTIITRDRSREFSEKNWKCSSQKLQSDLGFQPHFSLEAGLHQTISWAQNADWL